MLRTLEIRHLADVGRVIIWSDIAVILFAVAVLRTHRVQSNQYLKLYFSTSFKCKICGKDFCVHHDSVKTYKSYFVIFCFINYIFYIIMMAFCF